MGKLTDGERAMIARARHALTRLVGLEAGDKLADELYETRRARTKNTPDSQGGESDATERL